MAVPKNFHTDLLDFGLDYIRARIAAGDTVQLHVVKAYAFGDSYATVLGNSVGNVALTTGDLTLAANGTGRKVTVGAKNITAASANSGASPDLGLAILNTTASKVMAVTDETSNQVVTSGNPISVATFFLSVAQPV